MTLTIGDIGTITAIVATIGAGCIWVVKLIVDARLAAEVLHLRQHVIDRISQNAEKFMPRSELAAELKAIKRDISPKAVDHLRVSLIKLQQQLISHSKDREEFLRIAARLESHRRQ